ncbi:MAG TPA: hypothetical protein VFD66_02760 [Verrucomicrobiae bacterium]|nr:hypothetical protein [Verrucomicrobiae bacterium]
MNKITCRPSARDAAYALLVTMGVVGMMLVLLASVLAWGARESSLTTRNNLYNASLAAAEGATEMVIAQMNRDFLCQSVNADLGFYRNLTPGTIQGTWPLQFEFGDGAGDVNQTGVISLGPATVTNLNSQFAGLYGLVMPFRITAQARMLRQMYDVPVAVSQHIQLAAIPVFQFAIFYTLNLEINPGPQMIITGKVHSNGTIYTAPVSGLEYRDFVTAAGMIINNRDPNDPQYGSSKVPPVYDTQHLEKVGALTLPVSTDNSPSSVQEILKPPPQGEDPASEIGQQRYYNKADLIITTTTNGVQVTAGLWNNFTPIQPDVTNGPVTGYSFLTTTNSFKDLRENKNTITSQIDVAALKTWIQDPTKGSGVNALAKLTTGHELDSVYVDDKRVASGKLTVVRVVNGAALPNSGLTVATQLPLYVKGHFNLNNGDITPGQTNTLQTLPASLVGDSITILSQNWNDNDAGTTLAQRAAANTTVNAAFLGGIVETTAVGSSKYYSGGVENFPRFLEDWSNRSLTYNGSMVVMFDSRFATNLWQQTGNYYNPPLRKWAFDVNFLNQAKLPPGTPQVRKLVRGQWSVVSSYTP